MEFIRRILDFISKNTNRNKSDDSSIELIAPTGQITELDRHNIGQFLYDTLPPSSTAIYLVTMIELGVKVRIAIDIQPDFILPQTEKINFSNFGTRRNHKEFVIKGQNPCAENYAIYGHSTSLTPNKIYLDFLVKRGYIPSH